MHRQGDENKIWLVVNVRAIPRNLKLDVKLVNVLQLSSHHRLGAIIVIQFVVSAASKALWHH